MAENALLALSISLCAIFASTILNVLSIGIDYVGYRMKRTSFSNFIKLVFFAVGWSVVAILYYIGHSEIHFTEQFISSTFYYNIILTSVLIIIWALNINYFRKDKAIDMWLYKSAGYFMILFLMTKIASYFIHDFYLETAKGIIILIPAICGFFIVVKSMIQKIGKKNG